jgi:hypothetical protein
MGQFLQNSHSVKISKNAAPLDTVIIQEQDTTYVGADKRKTRGKYTKSEQKTTENSKK